MRRMDENRSLGDDHDDNALVKEETRHGRATMVKSEKREGESGGEEDERDRRVPEFERRDDERRDDTHRYDDEEEPRRE